MRLADLGTRRPTKSQSLKLRISNFINPKLQIPKSCKFGTGTRPTEGGEGWIQGPQLLWQDQNDIYIDSDFFPGIMSYGILDT